MSKTNSTDSSSIDDNLLATESCEKIISNLKESPELRSQGLGTVFKDWLTVLVAVLQRDDSAYNTALDNHLMGNPDSNTRTQAAEAFAEAFAALLTETKSQDRPLLGDVYMDVGHRSESLGQHFSPYHICKLMAEMQVNGNDITEATEDNPLRIADPACGDSRMQIAVSKAARSQREDIPIYVEGIDLDETCAKMSVINLAIYQIPSRVYHGNSLTQEMHTVWEIDPTSRGLLPVVNQIDDPDPPLQLLSEDNTSTDTPSPEETSQPTQPNVPSDKSNSELSDFL